MVLVLYAGYTLFATGVSSGRAQRRLVQSFEARAARASTPVALGGVPEALDASSPRPPAGQAVAILKIPKLGLEQAVVEGTRFGDLAKGPGHYVDTPLPGDPGNAGIAGHRTTYGAPFFRLPELAPGDLILMTTLRGTARFRVTSTEVVKPSQRSVLDPTPQPTLTLTTCHPAFRATQRFVVHAEARSPAKIPVRAERPDEVGDASAVPAITPAPGLADDASSRSAHVTATAVAAENVSAEARRAVLAALALALAWALLQVVARRRPVLAWLALVLPVAVSMVLLFDAVNRLLADAL